MLWILLACRVVWFGAHAKGGSADVAIVLGAAAWGHNPSPVYRERIREAVTLYKNGRVKWLIFTGGTPSNGYPSEGQVGREYAVHQGVPAAVIFEENESRSTWQNLIKSQDLMRSVHASSALIVSDSLHLFRASAMAKNLGINATPIATATSRYTSAATWTSFLWRETWLYLAYLIFGSFS